MIFDKKEYFKHYCCDSTSNGHIDYRVILFQKKSLFLGVGI